MDQEDAAVAEPGGDSRSIGCVLGIDPGLNRTGYALLERTSRGPRLREGGVIRSASKRPLAERVLEIGDGIRELVQQYRPAAVAIEQVFSTPRFPKTAILMAHARGAILYASASSDVPVTHYSATQIKRLLTGNGRADKEQVQLAIRRELGLSRVLEPNDVADAVAAALCHYYSVSRSRLLTMADETDGCEGETDRGDGESEEHGADANSHTEDVA